jgi:cell filamentation protein
MPIDPYFYPDSNTLQNRLGLRDPNDVEAVISDSFDRRAVLILKQPAITTVDGFKALHKSLFAELFEWAGEPRTANLYLAGARYARVDIIDAALAQCFDALSEADIFTGQPLDQFCAQLASHISTLNAIAPFRIGNRRILHLHAERLMHHGGHGAAWPHLSAAAWAKLLDDNFLSLAEDDLVSALSGRLTSEDILCDPRTGIGGIALLPLRDPPPGKRYLTSLKKAKTLVEAHLRAAQGEAALRIRVLLSSGASQTAMLSARQEYHYLFHPKGALFQLDILNAINTGKIRALIHDAQTPLECVREVATAIGIAVNEHPAAQIETLCDQLYTPPCAPGISPHDERMARQFLANLSAKNRIDRRFGEAQRFVDALVLVETMTSSVSDEQRREAAAKARDSVAQRIRTGEINLLPNTLTAPDETPFAEFSAGVRQA